jgi:hypothetical protein
MVLQFADLARRRSPLINQVDQLQIHFIDFLAPIFYRHVASAPSVPGTTRLSANVMLELITIWIIQNTVQSPPIQKQNPADPSRVLAYRLLLIAYCGLLLHL